LLSSAGINERVVLFGMPMKIHDEGYIFERSNKLLDSVDLRMHPTIRLAPLPVEVEPS